MGTFIQKDQVFSRKWFKAYGFILLGTFIMASGYVFFISPYKIVPGGVYGIAIVLHHTFNLPVGMTALAFNIPLTLLGIKILGPRFGAKTIIGFILTAVFIDGLTHFWGEIPLVEDDALLSAIFGGLLIGIGVGFLFKAKATCGGTDVLAMIIAKYSKLPLGHLMIIIDSSIVVIGLLAFGDWKIPLYSWIVIFIMGKVIDVVLQGISYDKTLFIISDKHELLRDKIINDLKRGGTFLQGKGMYQGKDKQIIFTVVNRRELAMLEDYVHQIDPMAFMSVINANEIIGKGFKSLNEKVD
jgi:uncharacterized membrane-anchored protein YitT (DUF2179 family)